jgi:PadR family transcriptional regulator
VLRTLQAGELNGWDIMQRIRAVTDGILVVTPGALYPALHRLEERGLVSAEWGASENNRRARFYQLTAKGRKQLQSERATWSRFSGAVEALLRDA